MAKVRVVGGELNLVKRGRHVVMKVGVGDEPDEVVCRYRTHMYWDVEDPCPHCGRPLTEQYSIPVEDWEKRKEQREAHDLKRWKRRWAVNERKVNERRRLRVGKGGRAQVEDGVYGDED